MLIELLSDTYLQLVSYHKFEEIIFLLTLIRHLPHLSNVNIYFFNFQQRLPPIQECSQLALPLNLYLLYILYVNLVYLLPQLSLLLPLPLKLPLLTAQTRPPQQQYFRYDMVVYYCGAFVSEVENEVGD